MTIQDAIKTTHASACMECGRCTGSCPMSRATGHYSPRSTVRAAVLGGETSPAGRESVWECLTCGQCMERCPSDVQYVDLIRALRAIGRDRSIAQAMCVPEGESFCSHGGLLHAWMRLSARSRQAPPDLGARPDKVAPPSWVSPDSRVSEKGDCLYFAGCLPYFDASFTHLGARTLDAARNAVKILNTLGIDPVVSRSERCCGHDLLWNGDRAGFDALARLNAKMIRESGARRIVATCAECVRTLKVDYAPYLAGSRIEVLHMAQLLAQDSACSRLGLSEVKLRGTYHDPCRLGRHLGVYDAPRAVLGSIPGLALREMERHGKNALCCGTSGWTHCDRFSKSVQHRLLQMASDTGADVLITACPKCAIHLSCAMRGNDKSYVRITDFTTLIGEAL